MTEVVYSPKIKPEHLARKAIVYLRQSSERQVRQNTESQLLQYAVAERVRALGWKQVEIITSDLGLSAGIASAQREGFERVLSWVALGEVGIVGSREVSRLSRTDKDWCRLLEVCQIFGTLIADEHLPVELMWGVGPATSARLAQIDVHTIGQLAKLPGRSLERMLGHAAGEKLTALAWNRDPREIRTNRRVQSAGAQSALGKQPAEERVFRPTLRHLADRIATRLRAKSRPGRTVTVRVRFGDLHSVTRSVTLEAPISATAILAEIAEQLVRAVLADYPDERTISLLAISVSHLEEHTDLQLELPLWLEDERRRPGTRPGMARDEITWVLGARLMKRRQWRSPPR
jgi:hypothetical protein